jgi:hypothetical protein
MFRYRVKFMDLEKSKQLATIWNTGSMKEKGNEVQ